MNETSNEPMDQLSLPEEEAPVQEVPTAAEPKRAVASSLSSSLYDHFSRMCRIHNLNITDAIRQLIAGWDLSVSYTCLDCGCRTTVHLDESQPISDFYADYRCPKCGGTNCEKDL